MSIIRIALDIAALPNVCFDLARDVDAHLESARATNERAVAGVTSGLTLGDEVTWRGRHFGVMQEFTSRIVAFDPPRHFRDEMVRGAFKRFVHDHYFEAIGMGTRMVDVVDFEPPFGVLGAIADGLVLASYLRRFLETRGLALKRMAVTGQRRTGVD